MPGAIDLHMRGTRAQRAHFIQQQQPTIGLHRKRTHAAFRCGDDRVEKLPTNRQKRRIDRLRNQRDIAQRALLGIEAQPVDAFTSPLAGPRADVDRQHS